MSIRSWRQPLEAALAGLAAGGQEGRPRVAVVGLGQELRGDDAAGCFVARRLQTDLSKDETRLVLEAGPAPESQTGPLRKFRPALVIFVDAAQLGEAPGAVRWLPWEATAGTSNSTHGLPIEMTARYLSAMLGCQIFVIGIQPAEMTLGAALTPAVQAAADELAAGLLAVLGDVGGQDEVAQ